jgi:hypothetical protein
MDRLKLCICAHICNFSSACSVYFDVGFHAKDTHYTLIFAHVHAFGREGSACSLYFDVEYSREHNFKKDGDKALNIFSKIAPSHVMYILPRSFHIFTGKIDSVITTSVFICEC